MTRRHFIAATAALLAGGACTSDSPSSVSLMAAGSLNHALENGLAKQQSEAPLEIEAHGSVTVARLVAEGRRNPDIVSLADAALFDGPLHPAWHVEFATNALVLAYNPDTAAGRRLAEAGPADWYEPLLRSEVRLGRTDPDLDPLGYRTLFALDLAGRYYELPDLSARLLDPRQIYPETALISQFEVGAIDAAFAYRSMATARGYAFVELPPQINLSSPAHARNWYERATYRLPDGKVVRGGPISYASTIRHLRPEVRAVFRRQCRGPYLTAFGFSVPDDYPRVYGDAPAPVSSAF